MPYKAEYNGHTLIPSEVPNGVTVRCLDCGGKMGVRCGPHKPCNDGRARHFYHLNGEKDTSVVHESDTHIRNKMASLNLLHEVFKGNIAELTDEKQLAAPHTDADHRIADVFLQFDTPDDVLGDGVIIEVQHKHKSKNIDGVTRDYVKQGYAVVWVGDSDFEGDYALLDESDIYWRAKQSVWPDLAPPQSKWDGLGFEQRQKERWQKSAEKGLKQVKVPATTVRGWFIPSQKEYWKNEYQFTAGYRAIDHFAYLPRWKERFPDYNGYKMDHYRLQAAIPHGDTHVNVPAKTYNHWYWPTRKEYWNDRPWDERFNINIRYPTIPQTGKTKASANWVNKWLLENKLELQQRFSKSWESSERIAVDCDHCSTTMKVDPIRESEVVRTRRCGNCGNWNVLKNDNNKAKA